MFVACDIESTRNGDRQQALTVSYGREDGTCGTHYFEPTMQGVHNGLLWLFDNLTGHHTDSQGKTYRQVPIGFHLNHDAAVYGVAFDETEMMLIHKSTQRHGIITPLCNTNHDPATCDRIHRLDPKAIRDIITDGGEADLLGWHPLSSIAIAFTPGRRIYMEHRPKGDLFDGRRVLDIHDVGRAFTGSLEKVIDSWRPELGLDQRAIIARGKEARSTHFHNWDIPDVAAYSEAECVALTRCCRLLIDMVRLECHVAIKPSRLFGAGSVANATMRHYGVPRREDSDLGREELGLMTYFGGMIETPVVGRIRGTISEVDINSAYPDKLRNVPCMKESCGHWLDRSTLSDNALIGTVMVDWDVTDCPTSTPPFMVRDTEGNVYEPQRGRTLAPIAEYRAAVQQFGNKITLHKAIWWEPDCHCGTPLPFQFLETLYAKRLDIKSRMKLAPYGTDDYWQLSVRETAIKLVLNSMYGKMAQQRPEMGIYTNLHVAAYVTGATRAQVRHQTWATEAAGGTVVYQHTDSVKAVDADPRDDGKTLGAWGREPDLDDFFVIQPGFAFPITPGAKASTRGVRKADVYDAFPAWLDTTELLLPPHLWPPFTVKTTRMMSRRQAIARNKPWTAGTFEDDKMDITVRSQKRNNPAAYPLPGYDGAWVLPPKLEVSNQATLADRLGLQDEWDILAQDWRDR